MPKRKKDDAEFEACRIFLEGKLRRAVEAAAKQADRSFSAEVRRALREKYMESVS